MAKLVNFLPLIFSFIFSLFFVSLDLTTFDMYTHMFFAKHYKENWFSLIDWHLAAGLDLSTYPPLAHQLVALLSLFLPLEISYYLVLIASWIFLAYSSAKFFTLFLKLKNFWQIYIYIFLTSGILITLFVFGQLTTVIGLAFGFLSLYFFLRFLKSGRFKEILHSSFSLSLTAFSHNLSLLIIVMVYLFVFWFERKVLIKKLNYILFFIIFSFVLSSIVYYPSISKTLSNSLVPSKEILHWSRNPFASRIDFERWLSMYGMSIFMLALPILLFISKIKNWKNFLKLYFIAIFFFLIGLGRVTPLTKIFWKLEYWLTYERFSLVATIIFTALFASFLPEIPRIEILYGKHSINLLQVIFLILFLIINLQQFFYCYTLFFGSLSYKRQEITAYTLRFLNTAQSGYRYQTFGYGRPIGQIYLYSKLPTLDTDYFTGRTIDWIRNSGIDEIDQAKNKNFLEKFMNHTDEYSIKYIITFTDFYHYFMSMYDWKQVATKEIDGKKIIIWENPHEIKKVQSGTEKISLINYLWGLVPVLTLFVFIVLIFKYR